MFATATRPLLGHAAFEDSYPRFPSLADAEARVRDDQFDLWVDLSSYVNTNNPTLLYVAPAFSVYRVFRNLGLRHIFILDHHSRVVGLVTRKDLVHTTLEHLWQERSASPVVATSEQENSMIFTNSSLESAARYSANLVEQHMPSV